MTAFEYVSILLSIVVSLALAHLLHGVSHGAVGGRAMRQSQAMSQLMGRNLAEAIAGTVSPHTRRSAAIGRHHARRGAAIVTRPGWVSAPGPTPGTSSTGRNRPGSIRRTWCRSTRPRRAPRRHRPSLLLLHDGHDLLVVEVSGQARDACRHSGIVEESLRRDLAEHVERRIDRGRALVPGRVAGLLAA